MDTKERRDYVIREMVNCLPDFPYVILINLGILIPVSALSSQACARMTALAAHLSHVTEMRPKK